MTTKHFQYTTRGWRRRRVAINCTARGLAQGHHSHKTAASFRRQLVRIGERDGFAWSIVRGA